MKLIDSGHALVVLVIAGVVAIKVANSSYARRTREAAHEKRTKTRCA